ncbi:MAG: FkbM family methyltransferase [Bacteroidota bacterium]
MLKDRLKYLLKQLPIPLTKNHKYDILTRKIIHRHLGSTDNAIDVGVLDGEILDDYLKAAPNGIHTGFEPIPEKINRLQAKYEGKNIRIEGYALSNESGESSFNLVESNPSYSGLKKRTYDKPNEVDTSIKVQMRRLDEYLDELKDIKLIKIDVEGAEYLVLEGGKALIARDKPLLIFEHGIGGADVYGIRPEQLFALVSEELGYEIFLLDTYLKKQSPLSKYDLVKEFDSGSNYYFVAAHPLKA